MQQDSLDPLDWPTFDGDPYDPATAIPFTPVPRLRARRRGWSAERQRWFIFCLSRCGSVARAARACGMSARTAYRLLDAAGGDSFAAAWDRALDEGIERVRADALQRALGGAFIPVFRRGKLVRVEHRGCDRLALALLSGKDQSIARYRQTAVSRRALRQDFAAVDAVRAEEARSATAAAAHYRQQLADLLARGEERQRSEGGPRVRRL